jgi:phosphoserine phosphatase RsbU/P
LNVDTGEIKFSCAGHNPPIVIDKSGRVNYLTSKVGLVLGAMKGLPYKTMTGKLDKGEKIFLYTDGVTEATNEKSQLYGEDRLLKVAEKNADKSLRNLLKNVSDDIDDFVLDCEQFDDITMLAIEYFGP